MIWGDKMNKITKIEVQKNNKERFNIYIDQVFTMGISMDTLVAFNLKKGDIVDKNQIDAINQEEYDRQAINQAMQYLSYRKRTRKEIKLHLLKQDFPETVIARAIDYCEHLQLIDHRDYMISLKNTLLRTTDKGPEIFRQKLIEAGIEADLIDEGVQLYEEEQPIDAIVTLGEKIMKQKKGPVSKVKLKIQQSLQQKGYRLETIYKVMDQLEIEQDSEMIDKLLQRDLEKVYNKNQKKYSGQPLYMKTVEGLLRKGYQYDEIRQKLSESGIENE